LKIGEERKKKIARQIGGQRKLSRAHSEKGMGGSINPSFPSVVVDQRGPMSEGGKILKVKGIQENSGGFRMGEVLRGKE